MQHGPEPMNSLDLPGRPADTRVVVAMSGGVDSSVVAGLLKRRRLRRRRRDAAALRSWRGRRTAPARAAPARTSPTRAASSETLGIPHYVLDYEERFRKAVIDPFAESYVAGETPIPCVSCNQTVKFADLLADRARPRRRCAGDRPLYPQPRQRRAPRAVPPGRRRPRPELFPVRHHAGADRLSALSARRHVQARRSAPSPSAWG